MVVFFDFSFQGTNFTVPNGNLMNFFLHRPEVFVAPAYVV
jgi:hypothetical protein